MPEPLSDLALTALVAERVMGYVPCPPGCIDAVQDRHAWHDSDRLTVAFDPLADDRDFGALLDKCAERWGVWMARPHGGRECSFTIGHDQVTGAYASDTCRRRALVTAAAAAVRAEGEAP